MKKRYSEEERTAYVAAWETSGLSKWEYAKQQGIYPSTFNNWTKPAARGEETFVEIRTKASTKPEMAGIEVEIIRLKLPQAITAGELRQLMGWMA
jgi:transposase-like protein